MNLTQEQIKGQETVNNIIQECWKDESFKQELLKNPTAKLEEFLGKKLNFKSKAIKVMDQTDENCIYINIPKKLDIDEMELSEEQLEQVSGGILGCIAACICIAYCAYEVGCGAAAAAND